MTKDSITTRLADEIRDVYRTDPQQGRQGIERLLQARLADHAASARQEILQQLAEQFQGAPVPDKPAGADNESMRRVFGLILGREVESQDLLSAEFLERLAQSLNTIFDSLNELVSVINMSFSGGTDTGDQTIRQFIGFHLDGGDQTRTLEEYLGQINAAFLTSHEAFKKAAHVKVEQILRTLDPKEVAKERGSGLKIGPMRKAEDFDILSEKIERIKRWFDSGRFMEDFLREFENNCDSLNRNLS